MADLYKQQWDQMRRLPERIEAAERRLAALYRQAMRLDMHEIMRDTNRVNEAWDRETMLAYLAQQEAQRAN